MKKKLLSITLGLVFTFVPTFIYACADVLTVGNLICRNTGSAVTSSGVEVCFWACQTLQAPETPVQQNGN